MTRILLQRLNNWRHLPLRVQLLLLPSWGMLGVARLAVLLLPFRFIARWLGPEAGVTPFTPLLSEQQATLARDIGRSVEVAARYTPWDSLCQPQALVARFWLTRFGIPCIINYGLRKNGSNGLDAHAWVCAGPVAVTGGNAYGEFVVVRSFIGQTTKAH